MHFPSSITKILKNYLPSGGHAALAYLHSVSIGASASAREGLHSVVLKYF